MNNLYISDKHRNGGGYVLRFLKVLRTAHTTKNKIIFLFCKLILKYYRTKYGLEIPPETSIGEGLYLGHAFNITINGHSVIGKNCNIHKGVLIGRENRGKRKGCPTLGDCVWVGTNAVIVGKVTIGDDVLIAPNTYVNCDIPSHSIVFGNPCIIKQKDNATEYYVNNRI